MKHGSIKKAIAIYLAGGLMAFTLAACGDSENKDNRKGTVQNVTQESGDGTIEAAKNGEAANTTDPSNKVVSVGHAGFVDSKGNGTTTAAYKPGEGPKPGEDPVPGAEQKQPQPSEPKPAATSQSTKETQPVHTHSFQGGNCSTPATCSCGATGDYGGHNWATQTVHHDATGHYESRVTGTEQVVVDTIPAVYRDRCICGDFLDERPAAHGKIWVNGSDIWDEGHGVTKFMVKDVEYIYESRDKVEDVWVVDSPAWDENTTTCSICGARQ